MLILAIPACAADEDVDCDRLAAHKQEILTQALSPALRQRIDADAQREAMAEACQRRSPAPSVARCQLEAKDIDQFTRCEVSRENSQ